jgi:glycosyltransferase involved in cell wall biosynthesis
MKIAVVIATYQRPDGKTPSYLIRALRSIEAQVFKDYKVYVIGDDYANNEEFYDICGLFSFVKAYNVPLAPERSLYPFGDYRLFCSGGVGASQRGIVHALYDGYEYICHLDHDDWWNPDHLESINAILEDKNPLFACTISTYCESYLPKLEVTNQVLNFYPIAMGMVCSSSCVKYSETSLRARDVFKETGSAVPADADLWSRLSEEMKNKNKSGYIFTKVTCHHSDEGYSKHKLL